MERQKCWKCQLCTATTTAMERRTPWDYRELPADWGLQKISDQQRLDSSKAFCQVLRYGGGRGAIPLPHPHELPLDQLLERADKRKVPGLSKKTVYEVFEANTHLELRQEMSGDTGAVSEVVRVVGGPDTCEECMAAGTTHSQLKAAKEAVKDAARERRRRRGQWHQIQQEPSQQYQTPAAYSWSGSGSSHSPWYGESWDGWRQNSTEDLDPWL